MKGSFTSRTPLAKDQHPQNEFRILPATTKDMGAVSKIVRSSAAWYKPIIDEQDIGEHEVDIEWARKNFKIRDFYLGQKGDQAVGTISMQYFDNYAYLGYIYLDVDFVGKGYGKRLMDHAAKIAKNKNVQGFALICHPEANWARKAYLKYGFKLLSSDKNEILNWQDGALKVHYEQGFELYTYEFSKN